MLQDKGEFTSTCVAKNSKRYSLPRLSSLFSLREREKRSENRSALETGLYPVTKIADDEVSSSGDVITPGAIPISAPSIIPRLIARARREKRISRVSILRP